MDNNNFQKEIKEAEAVNQSTEKVAIITFTEKGKPRSAAQKLN